MANFCTLIDTNAPPNHPNVKAPSKSLLCEDFAAALALGQNGCFDIIMSVQKCKNI